MHELLKWERHERHLIWVPAMMLGNRCSKMCNMFKVFYRMRNISMAAM
jgi:hypothetical protein